MYFLAFLRLYLSCENSVLLPNVALLATSASMISVPLCVIQDKSMMPVCDTKYDTNM